LRRAGWRVLRVWEHELRNESRLMARFWKLLSNSQSAYSLNIVSYVPLYHS
jgi:G:T-mismatch repair DNA endonuclease (very short patch repair protein)